GGGDGMSAIGLLGAALLVGIGGGLGAVVRWGVSALGLRLVAAQGREHLDETVRPGTTMLANLLACFLLGLVVARLGSAGGVREFVYLMLAAGFCGGLSTMSTAAADVVELVRRRTFSLALAYLLLSAGAGMAALWLGLVLFGGRSVLAWRSVLAADAAGGDNRVLMDAGPIARRGAPVAAVLADLAGALTFGGAAVAGWLLREPADRARALLIVAIAAGATTLLRGAGLVLSYAVATGQPVGSPRFGSDLQVFFGTDLGVWLLSGVVLAAATTTIAVLGTSRGIARTVTALASLVAFAAAMTGHAAGDETHEVGTSTMLIHLLAVGIWLGGLAVLQLLP